MKKHKKDKDAVILQFHQWGNKEQTDCLKKLLSLLNSFASQECRTVAVDVLTQLLSIPVNNASQFLVQLLLQQHTSWYQNSGQCSLQQLSSNLGPYYPRKASKSFS